MQRLDSGSHLDPPTLPGWKKHWKIPQNPLLAVPQFPQEHPKLSRDLGTRDGRSHGRSQKFHSLHSQTLCLSFPRIPQEPRDGNPGIPPNPTFPILGMLHPSPTHPFPKPRPPHPSWNVTASQGKGKRKRKRPNNGGDSNPGRLQDIPNIPGFPLPSHCSVTPSLFGIGKSRTSRLWEYGKLIPLIFLIQRLIPISFPNFFFPGFRALESGFGGRGSSRDSPEGFQLGMGSAAPPFQMENLDRELLGLFPNFC